MPPSNATPLLTCSAEHNLTPDNGDDTFVLSSKRPSDGSEAEDSNVAYNRICAALQALIDEAQLAVERTTLGKPSTGNPTEDSTISTSSSPTTTPSLQPSSKTTNLEGSTISSSSTAPTLPPQQQQPSVSTLRSTGSAPVQNDLEASQRILQPRLVRSNSLLNNARPVASTYMLATSTYGGTDDVSKILWRQKHEEQHDRYRRSSQRLTLELEREFLQSPITTDSEDSEDSQLAWSALPRLRPGRASDILDRKSVV